MTGDRGICTAHHKNSLGCCSSGIPVLNDGNSHSVKIIFEGETGRIQVFIDSTTPCLSLKLNMKNIFPNDCWIGFTASGNERHEHSISNWKLEAITQENKENVGEGNSHKHHSEQEEILPFLEFDALKQSLLERSRDEQSVEEFEREEAAEAAGHLEEILVDLHKLGMVIYFNDPVLKNVIITHPIWFNNGLDFLF